MLDVDIFTTVRGHRRRRATIADYLGAELLACGDLIRADWSGYPNIARWLDTMKSRPSWAGIHEVIDGFAASLEGKEFSTIG